MCVQWTLHQLVSATVPWTVTACTEITCALIGHIIAVVSEISHMAPDCWRNQSGSVLWGGLSGKFSIRVLNWNDSIAISFANFGFLNSPGVDQWKLGNLGTLNHTEHWSVSVWTGKLLNVRFYQLSNTVIHSDNCCQIQYDVSIHRLRSNKLSPSDGLSIDQARYAINPWTIYKATAWRACVYKTAQKVWRYRSVRDQGIINNRWQLNQCMPSSAKCLCSLGVSSFINKLKST